MELIVRAAIRPERGCDLNARVSAVIQLFHPNVVIVDRG